MKQTSLRIFGSLIFFLGVIAGFCIAIVSIWGKVESVSYFFRGATYEPFYGLRCPLLMTRSETGIITVVFDNRTNSEDNFFYKMQISRPVAPRQFEDQVLVPARGTKSVRLSVNQDDVDLRFFIFVRIVVSPNASRSTSEADCGILVANIPGMTGSNIFTIALALSLLGTAIGFSLWLRSAGFADSNLTRIMQALGIVVLLAMLAGLIGWWIAGIFLIVITLLLALMFVRLAVA